VPGTIRVDNIGRHYVKIMIIYTLPIIKSVTREIGLLAEGGCLAYMGFKV
jgi:hypothetical protein